MAEEKQRYKEFGTAARNGDLETIQRMLTGENPVPVDCLSCILENKEDVEFLVTPLVQACQGGHLAIVQELIRAGADINWKGRYFTALHVACDYGKSPEVVETLLAAGAGVNATVANGKTPLMCLVSCKARITMAQKQTIARLLLAAKCDVNQESEFGYTALSLACRRCQDDEIVRLLCEHGARVTPKALFACFLLNDAHASPLKNVSCLLEHGIDVNTRNTDGKTAIHWAAIYCNTDLARLLLDHNADVSIQDRFGQTALMEATFHISRDDQMPIIGMLLERMNTVDKKLIDLQDVDGYTALHFAANRTCVIQELLNWGPNLFCQTVDTSSTALHSCLLSKWCYESQRLSNLQCLVEHVKGYGLNGINIQDKRGRTVLHLALEEALKNKSVIEYLSNKVDVSIQDVDGNTPLHSAVMSDLSEAMVQLLLRSPHATKAANTLNGHGRTPLHEAILFRKNTNLVQAIGQIADVNIRSHDGKTALHYAVTERAASCVDLLLKLNANISMRDNDGNTALMLACNICDDDDNKDHSQLTMIFDLCKYGVAYGELFNMI